jgi:hypothetical protein
MVMPGRPTPASTNDCPCSDAGYGSDVAVEAEDAGVDSGAGGAAPDGGTGGTGGGGGATGGPADAGVASGLHCENRKPNSLACARGSECNSGFCVDGYCCNVASVGAAAGARCEDAVRAGGEGERAEEDEGRDARGEEHAIHARTQTGRGCLLPP